MIINNLVLSIFPGIDLFGRAFEEQGYCVVRGPDLLWGGDIKKFHPAAAVFEGVIGGPPCIGESNLAYLNGMTGYSLWDEALRVIAEAAPTWWILEAVKKHEAPFICKLSPRYLGEKQSRRRYFHSNIPLEPHIDISLFENPDYAYAVRAANSASGRGTIRRRMASYTFPDMCELQGLPRDFDLPGLLAEAKQTVVGNGVPLSMGNGIARAVRKAVDILQNEESSERA